MEGLSNRSRNCFDTLSRRHTTAFCYPGCSKIYRLLGSRAISDLICDWIAVLSDCHILHAKSPQNTLCMFDEAQVLYVIKDSDEESRFFAEILYSRKKLGQIIGTKAILLHLNKIHKLKMHGKTSTAVLA